MPSLVAEVMTYNVVAVRQEAEFKEIVAVMQRRRVSAFPVLDDGDRVVGIVSEADLLPHEAYPARPSARNNQRRRFPYKADALTAGELMTSPAITISPEATVTEAARVMHSRKVKRLPVIGADGRLVGIVSQVDLLGVYDRPDAQIRTEITERVIAGDFVLDPREFTVLVGGGVVTISGKVERQGVALGLLEAIWDVAGVVDVRDRLSYPVRASEARRTLRAGSAGKADPRTGSTSAGIGLRQGRLRARPPASASLGGCHGVLDRDVLLGLLGFLLLQIDNDLEDALVVAGLDVLVVGVGRQHDPAAEDAIPELGVRLVDLLFLPLGADAEDPVADGNVDLLIGVDSRQLGTDDVMLVRHVILHPHALAKQRPEHGHRRIHPVEQVEERPAVPANEGAH